MIVHAYIALLFELPQILPGVEFEMNLRFKPKVSQMRKSWNGSVDSKDIWIHKVNESHRVSPKSLCCQRASTRTSFLLRFKWSPRPTPGYTGCTSSKTSSLSNWKLFTLATQYHLTFVLALHHFLICLRIKYTSKWCCIYFSSDYFLCVSGDLKIKIVIALFMKSEHLKDKTD